MEKLAEVSIRRPVFATMIILALVVVGAASYFRLGVDRFPMVELANVSVRTLVPGASPEEVETLVTRQIEEVVNTVEGIDELRSISIQGVSVVFATFTLDRDIDVAAQDVRDRVATVVNRLPRGLDPPVISKFNNESSPVLTIAFSGDRSLREITEIADKVVKVQLERSAGVGEVRVVGGLERAITVWLEADRLAAYQIPVTAVREAVQRQNADIPGGNITGPAREEVLRTMGRIVEPRDFNDLVVATVRGSPIRIRDIGWAEDGTKEQRSLSRLNGVPTVQVQILRQSGANTVAVIEGVKENLRRVADQVPADVTYEIINDQSRYIYAALREINVHLILGSILASLVVLVFMRSWRSTLIAAVAIPASVISTFGMMWALDFTLNSVTMLALVLMVGVVIDDAIVVLENIFRFVEEKKMRPFQAARAATSEIALAVMATTFSLVVIFVPVSFMSSISGRFLYQFGLTAAVAVLVSLLVSFTLTPMMSARLLRAEDAASGHGEAQSRRGFYAWIDRHYEGMLRWSMAHRVSIMFLAAAGMAASFPLYGLVQQEYIPSNVDEAEFEVSVTAPPGTSVAAMNEILQTVEGELRAIPSVRLILCEVGGGFLGGVASANCYVRITPHEERLFSLGRLWQATLRGEPWSAFTESVPQRQVMQQVRRRLAKFTDLRAGIRNLTSFNIGGPRGDIDFSLRGPDLEALAHYAEQLRLRSPELGIVDADVTLKLESPELRVVIDRQRAADLNVDTAHIATALQLMVGGDTQVSRFYDAGVNEEYDVEMRLADRDRDNADTISRLFVPRGGGGLVRLDNLVRLEAAKTGSRIDRLNRQRQASLRAQVAPGFALADRVTALRQAADELNMPPGYTSSVSGRARELERTFTEFLWAFLLSIIFMYMILAAQYESLVHPFTILLSLPLSVPFALLSLWATGNTLNLYSALGVLVLFGVVKKNAILQIDHMNKLREAGMERGRAIIEANRDRLRPILMTTLALVAGMLPLALGSGPGAEERRAVSVVVIGGQSLCLLLTLLVTPVAYSVFEDTAQLLRRRSSAAPPSPRRRSRWLRWRTEAELATSPAGAQPAGTAAVVEEQGAGREA